MLILNKFKDIFADTVCYEIPYHNLEKKNLNLSVVSPQFKSKVKYYEGLDGLTKINYKNSPYILMTDSNFYEKIFLSDNFESLLGLCQDSLRMLYVSSKISIVPNSNLIVRFTFNYNEKLTRSQLKFVLEVIEKINMFF